MVPDGSSLAASKVISKMFCTKLRLEEWYNFFFFYDNQSAICITKNSKIMWDLNMWVSKEINEIIVVKCVRTKNQEADIFTKSIIRCYLNNFIYIWILKTTFTKSNSNGDPTIMSHLNQYLPNNYHTRLFPTHL